MGLHSEVSSIGRSIDDEIVSMKPYTKEEMLDYKDRTGQTWREIAALLGMSERALHQQVMTAGRLSVGRSYLFFALAEIAMLKEKNEHLKAELDFMGGGKDET